MTSLACHTRSLVFVLVALATALVVPGAAPARTDARAQAASAPAPLIRVNGAGTPTTQAPRVVLMSTRDLRGRSWQLRSPGGVVVRRGRIGRSTGAWNRTWRFTHVMSVPRLGTAGSYHFVLLGAGGAPGATRTLPIVAPAARDTRLLGNALSYLDNQRDGVAVSGPFARPTAHLEDASAQVYAAPTFDADGGLTGTLTPTGRTVDVAGGFFDAGDYLKFVVTASYTQALLLDAARSAPLRTGARLAANAAIGSDWLRRTYDPAAGTLAYQVGLGDGNDRVTGDHDRWRLPQADAAITAAAGSPDWFLRHRPVFATGSPGATLSPNLAGRLAADFALQAQLLRRTAAAADAQPWLVLAQQVYAQADTAWTGRLVTAAPFDYYPEESWLEDMELAGAEIARALQLGGWSSAALPTASPDGYLADAARYAARYIDAPAGESLSVYDVSAFAHRELALALDASAAAPPAALAVTRAELVGDLRAQLEQGRIAARRDPFSLVVAPDDGADVAPRALGYVLTERWYRELGGGSRYRALAAAQLDWVLGANAWGTSFVVGSGGPAVSCLHHQVANLHLRRRGAAPALRGAVVAGPGDPAELADQGTGGASRPCTRRRPGLDGHGFAFLDAVGAYSSTEPTNDYLAPMLPLLVGD